MTAPLDQVEGALDHATGQVGGLQTGMSAHQRLSMQMRLASEDDPVQVADPAQWSRGVGGGVPNPNGRGLSAFEPNNVLLTGYADAKNASDQSKADDAARAAGSLSIHQGVPDGSVLGPGDGKVGAFISAALNAAQRNVPYVWGGTSLSNGVDCSGLVYAAAKAAGLPLQRYRAVDYLKLGAEVDSKSALPGDLVVYDEGGGNGHVGIYLGHGMMVAAPQSGENVRVQKVYGTPTAYRRLFTDQQLQQVALPGGQTGFSYAGMTYRPLGQVQGSTMPILENPALTAAALDRYRHNF
jgi:cell wall-associated NlpC family hydrolase